MADKQDRIENKPDPDNNAGSGAKSGETTPVEPIESRGAPSIPIEQRKNTSVDQGQGGREASNQALVDRLNRSDRWMIGLTSVIAAGGIVSAGIFGWQLSVMSGQLDAMEQDRRPWVGVEIVPASSLDFDVEGATLRYRILMKNTGKTPAVNVMVHSALFLYTKKISVSAQQNETCDDPFRLLRSTKIGDIGFSIFPNDVFNYETTDAISAEEIKEAVEEGAAARKTFRGVADEENIVQMMLTGCVTYDFPYKAHEAHRTSFFAEVFRKKPSDPDEWYRIRSSIKTTPASELFFERSSFTGNGAD